jgi:DNA-binding response OmpR family regulator
MTPIRILVADDEEALRELLCEQLAAQGYQTESACDGEEAIQKLQNGPFALVLLDINMPKKTGLEVLKYIREQGMKTHVIMLTGRLGYSIGSESMKLGADEFITKPFDLNYLDLAIKRILQV